MAKRRRLIPVMPSNQMARDAMREAQRASEEASDAAALAANARQMVLNRDPRFDTLSGRIEQLRLLTAGQEGLADMVAALSDSVDARFTLTAEQQAANAATLAANDASILSTVTEAQRQIQEAAAKTAALALKVDAGQAGDAAAIAAVQAQLDAEKVRTATLVDAETRRAQMVEAQLAARIALAEAKEEADRAALAARDAELTAALALVSADVTALKSRVLTLASGRASTSASVSVLAGSTVAINVTFEGAGAPDTNYLPQVVLDSSSISLFGALQLVSVTNRTKAGCTVNVKSTALLAITASITATVLALRLG